jgi:hypothetical protein
MYLVMGITGKVGGATARHHNSHEERTLASEAPALRSSFIIAGHRHRQLLPASRRCNHRNQKWDGGE